MTQAVLDAVRDLLPQIRERAEEGERLRVVPEASIKDLEARASSGCSSPSGTTASRPTRWTSSPRSS